MTPALCILRCPRCPVAVDNSSLGHSPSHSTMSLEGQGTGDVIPIKESLKNKNSETRMTGSVVKQDPNTKGSKER